ncbi:MAG: ComEC family competence protein [Chitinophagaceae bacterium]|jgi:competence protein ComEC|nr:ComEC family competence protein [Chitinophagaceae bacterium]MBK7678421.1 ComEC family competence protein [Chitinophagaceae bacterium]MBK8300220.1 ComEC family competence protein [Chitinophagaceae bacterium]MBK9658612.1 ComEC family competence protein [Chitinophagaceae bacterium]MBL0067067.1 ComEC family competence protein [Chitinophagaceae bacterium]
MALYGSNFWKKTPFLKLLLAAIAGIIVQWHFQVSITIWWLVLLAGTVLTAIFFLIPFFKRFRFAFINGIITSILFFSIGGMLTWQKDIRNDKQWLGNYYTGTETLIVTVDEPPVEKTKSVKANATVSYLLKNEQPISVNGKIILYFKKDSSLQLSYGSQIIFKKPLQEIKNSGNPGGFDYKRYSLFQGITHQVYLKSDEFELLNDTRENGFRKFIYSSREKVLDILRTNIKGGKELGLAEALLIGYKDDLEQSLVQSYTNTGVVHIIAISGLHLGLIYWLLALLLKPLKKRKKTKWLSPVLIITGLWLFSLLAGAQPSILRSALMFTCIVWGETFSRKTSIFNTMAVSAFILLCINPYFLWDVGFQLSYAAVLSIIIFMRPIYNWFYIKNKVLDFLWKLNAVTLAAQILTVPLSIYHFHQFPNLFILTNFLAVPLSSAILLGEIFLCVISFIPVVAIFIGKIISGLIWLMNTYIEKIESIHFSLWDGLQISILQAALLIFFAVGISYWLMEKSTTGLKLGLLAFLGFAIVRSWSFIQSNRQQKIIVYNVPQKRAIDIVNGRNYFFVGDSDLLANDFARNFHLKPSRILYRISDVAALDNLSFFENYLSYNGKHILLVDESISFLPQETKPLVDLLVISKNPKIYMKKLVASFNIKRVVFDGSVPAWKVTYWKKDCDSLQIPWHDVTMKGAFEMRLN